MNEGNIIKLEKHENNTKKTDINLKWFFILFSIMFLCPSIVYIIKGNSILNLPSNLSFFYLKPTPILSKEKILSTLFFVLVFLGLVTIYLLILKNYNKLFKTKKDIAKFILIVSIIFLFILPMTSTDVFYYIATGWSEAEYGVNPYYTSVKELSETDEYKEKISTDEILEKMPGVWKDTTIVYGPIWPLICKILSGLSMGNLTLALFIYKLFNLLIHLLNTYLIYKITNKKIFALIYGLNPMVLFEGLCNVHNDLLAICLILIALYFFVKKKNILFTVVFLSLATAVKYFAILLVPFLVIYYYRDKKILKRILYASGLAIIFIAILVLCYLLYMEDIEVLKGVFVQQSKFSSSMFLIIVLKASIKSAVNFAKGCMFAFIIIYLYNIIKLLFTKKEISFVKSMRTYNALLILFIFGTITSFNPWYTIWLIPTIMWQRGRKINTVINILTSSGLAYSIYFLFNDAYIHGIYFFALMITSIIISNIIAKFSNKKEIKVYGKNLID